MTIGRDYSPEFQPNVRIKRFSRFSTTVPRFSKLLFLQVEELDGLFLQLLWLPDLQPLVRMTSLLSNRITSAVAFS